MTDSNKLSRRERQIMDVLYAREGATVMEVVGELPDAPTDKAVRRLLQILEEKGHVRRRKEGHGYVYRPCVSKRNAGVRALRHVIDTFFQGSLDQAIALHMGTRGANLSDEDLDRLRELIEKAREEGR